MAVAVETVERTDEVADVAMEAMDWRQRALSAADAVQRMRQEQEAHEQALRDSQAAERNRQLREDTIAAARELFGVTLDGEGYPVQDGNVLFCEPHREYWRHNEGAAPWLSVHVTVLCPACGETVASGAAGDLVTLGAWLQQAEANGESYHEQHCAALGAATSQTPLVDLQDVVDAAVKAYVRHQAREAERRREEQTQQNARREEQLGRLLRDRLGVSVRDADGRNGYCVLAGHVLRAKECRSDYSQETSWSLELEMPCRAFGCVEPAWVGVASLTALGEYLVVKDRMQAYVLEDEPLPSGHWYPQCERHRKEDLSSKDAAPDAGARLLAALRALIDEWAS